MAEPSKNPLLSSKPSESDLTVSLHPLVLLTISDQVTRHSVRKQPGPVVGALLGQQRGRDITVEYAFPAAIVKGPEGQWRFNFEWMETRIQQYMAVHKLPALGFVGWFTLCPREGPLPEFVHLQKQAIDFCNDNAILLALHPEAIQPGDTGGGKLPITIYESVDDREQPKDDGDREEGSMQIDGDETSITKFRQLPYTIETDETEMIAIDYVAKGAGGAAAVDDAQPREPASKPVEPPPTDKKGKRRADPGSETSDVQEINGVEEPIKTLTPEEEDQIAGITTRLNGVKMLQSRLALLRKFIQSLPPSYISASGTNGVPISLTPTSPDPSHLPHLRHIHALLTRLSLLTPPTEATQHQRPLASASLAQSNDVSLVTLLSLLGQDIQALSELGRKSVTVEANKGSSRGKHQQQGGPKGAGGGGPGMGRGGPSGFVGIGEGDVLFAGAAGVNSAGASAMI
ncbi:uncharacterized protein Z519_02116 [Cladophialophora bantiana CBS 173.52]|uniref:COP9 signalosome complex subunit 6 n=1 Tax=Cladophialophora bantiana (strain ATCC 10958 / CBS 173.52 / CDC B-1940 / NIH 8579) TaxID=1442370 RepID=A0A0D2I0L7_CLAB1|nr:uncharacterized protein Z519_02116 [Cladophialophora bantiana CBS 173.52]KIW96725.1 hypothetical protein Z519_02116 [Cladophialophora bantiana CBS 173.52]